MVMEAPSMELDLGYEHLGRVGCIACYMDLRVPFRINLQPVQSQSPNQAKPQQKQSPNIKSQAQKQAKVSSMFAKVKGDLRL